MSEERRRAAGEDRRLRSQVQPPALEESNNDPLERLMTRWLEADERRMQREDQRREEDRRLQAQQQERWAQLLTEARRPAIVEPPPNIPKLTLQKFQEGVDDMSSFLKTFEVAARAGRWPEEQWSLYLRTSLSGAGMTAVSALSAEQQENYEEVKQTLLSTYQVSTEAYRRKVFEQSFDQNNADAWLRTYRQSYSQWLDSTDKTASAVLMELTIRKLPRWLETYMRNLNPDNFEELREAIVRYLGSQKRDDTSTKRTDRAEKSRTQMSDTPNRNRESEPRRLEMRNRKDATPFQFRDPRQMECFRCGKKGHIKRDCRVKLEGSNLAVAHMATKNLPRWTHPVKINNRPVLALLDTGCTKSMVHPRCVQESDHLPWKIPYKTASSTKTYFPAARVTLQIEGKDTELVVGVSPTSL